MRNLIMSVVAGLALLVAGQPLVAQVCTGNPALGGARTANVGIGASVYDGGKTYSAGAIFGSEWFFGGSYGYSTIDDSDLTSNELSAQAGWETETEAGLTLCPRAQLGYSFGLELGTADMTMWTAAPGVSAGYRTPLSPTVDLVPTGTVSLLYQRATIDDGAESVSDSETYGLLSGGLSFIIDQRFSVAPSVSVPVGLDGGSTSFGVGAMVGVGN